MYELAMSVSQPSAASPLQLAKPEGQRMSEQSLVVQLQPPSVHVHVLQSSPASLVSPMNMQGSQVRSVHCHIPSMLQVQVLQPPSGVRVLPGSQH
jgi:hypothetical protein